MYSSQPTIFTHRLPNVPCLMRANPEDIRILTILLDFRPVFGGADMAQSLWETAFKAFERVSSGALHLAADSKMQMRAPLNLFGGFITEKSGSHKNQINLKSAVCVHIVNSTRLRQFCGVTIPPPRLWTRQSSPGRSTRP